MNIKNSILLRVRIAFLMIMILAVMIIIKIVNIQYFAKADWKQVALKTDVRLKKIPATRGNIYTDDGSLLATSLPFYYLAIDPSLSRRSKEREAVYEQNIDALCDSLAKFFGDRSALGYKDYIQRKRRENRQYARLNKRLVNYHDKKRMEKWPLFKEGRMKSGVIFEKHERRFKPFSHLALRTVGYARDEPKKNGELRRIGAGLEKSFDSTLTGEQGQAWFENIGGGKWKPIHNQEEIVPKHGYNIHTTLDINLQDVVQVALKKALEANEADNGCAVVMEVATGKIKALANLDKITSNNGEVYYSELYNYAVGKRCEPGSTFKLASMMAILEERDDLSLDDSIEVGRKGYWKFHDRICRDAHVTSDGYLTLEEVMAHSSNVGVARLAYDIFYKDKVSQQRFIDYFRSFKLTQTLGFQLKGAAETKIKNPQDPSWSGISIPWMSHGYELEISPLHILTLYNAVANNGKMIQPILVDKISDANEMVEEYEARVLNKKVCSENTLEMIQKMLVAAVDYGTAKNIKTKNYKIAGKTGTAKRLVNGRYSDTYYTSFVGYFPADKPKYSCIVAIDNPTKGKIYGSQVAAPVFREIADKVYARDMDLHNPLPHKFEKEEGVFPVVQAGNIEDLKYITAELGLKVWNAPGIIDEWVQAKRDDEFKQIKWKGRELSKGEMPNVIGMTLRDALPLLENMGLRVEFNQLGGRVKKQSQIKGSKIIVGSSVKLELS